MSIVRPDFLRGRYANLAGYRTVNGTVVDSLLRTDRTGPIWELQCSCKRYFYCPHRIIAPAVQSGTAIYCGQCVPILEHSETFTEFRRKENIAKRQAEREQAAHQAEATKQNANKQAELAEKARWRIVANYQLNSGIPIGSSNWISFERWLSWSPEFRDEILVKVASA